MKATSLLFFSSSPIALPLFEALLKDPRFVVLGLVCQPDKPAGRGQKSSSPLIKTVAEARGVPVYQPEKLSKDTVLLERLKEARPDFLLTFAYGQLLSADWLKLPLKEALNVHPSLLPLYRGPAPLEAALLNGEKETGITLMRMAAAMDAGPIAFQRSFALPPDLTAGELYGQVALLAAEWIPDALLADFSWTEQNENQASVCGKLNKEMAFEDFKRPTVEVLRRYRAFTPSPGLWTTLSGKRLKLLKVLPASEHLSAGSVRAAEGRLFVGTVDGAVEILEVQLEGKKACSAADFLRGNELVNASLPS